MSADPTAALLADLPQWGFAALLLLARLGAAMMLLPGFGEAETPATIRLGSALALVVLLFPLLSPLVPPMPAAPLELAGMLVREVAVGLWFGWLVRLVLLALPMAGQIIAGAVGMTNVIQPDAFLGAGSAALSRMLGLAAPLLLLITGLWSTPLTALSGLYALLPPGHAFPVGDGAQATIQAVGLSFALALRLATPFLLAGLVYHTALALIGRLVPHLQLHFAAAPGQLLGGVALLGLLAPPLLDAWIGSARNVLTTLPGQ
ncbi:MAG: flagellar biosynthetic protein FliR [Acetobacteraceae bacterium]|nr:flagellar biosynthetic protein FliR [Acetobacteraceae bacterium]